MHANQSEVFEETGQAWWRYPMMWLVVGGPAVVVLASVLTLTLAIRHPDPVLNENQQATAVTADQDQAVMMPAMKARNHAATGQK